MSEEKDLPPSWALAPLADLGEWQGGGTPSKADDRFWTKGAIPWVSPKDMKAPKIFTTEDYITSEAVEESATTLIPVGSVLVVTRSGILRHTFPVAVTAVEAAINQDLKALTPHRGVVPEYVAYALKRYEHEILTQASKSGTTVQSILTPRLLAFQIPIAPTSEQARIFREIETQLTRLDAATTTLRRARANLKSYRASLLKAACEGRLVPTEAELARIEGREYETAQSLLEAIHQEREIIQKSLGRKQRRFRTHNPPQPRETLPAGWAWTTVEQLTPPDRPCAYGVLQPGAEVDAGVEFVRVGDIDNGKISWSQMRRIKPEIAAKYPRTRRRGEKS